MYRIAWIGFSLCFFMMACQQKTASSSLPYYNDPAFTALFLANPDSIRTKVTHAISDFSFTDQHGNAFGSKELRGKIHVANFFFTGCGSICPGMMQKLRTLNDSIGNDPQVQLVSFSVTPWRDSVPRLKDYAETNGYTSPRWHLLTGDKGAIYSLARRSYFAEESLGFSKDSTDFLHTEHVLLIDPSLRIRGIYNGTLALDMEQLLADLKLLQREYAFPAIQ
jgi:protein SCO1/2